MDFNKSLKLFEKYVKKYDLNEEPIMYKYKHTLRVVEFAKIICESEKFTEEETKVAIIAALLHDIARFKQWTEYKSWTSIDHGDLGYEILKKDDYIYEFISNKEQAETVLLAVKYHNKKEIPTNISNFDEKILKVIRDADKIDIMNTQFNLENEDSLAIEIDFNQKSDISEEVLQDFLNEKMITRKQVKNQSIFLIYYFAYLYDINYQKSFEIIDELNLIPIYLQLFHKLINSEEQYTIIEKKVLDYLHSKLTKFKKKDILDL